MGGGSVMLSTRWVSMSVFVFLYRVDLARGGMEVVRHCLLFCLGLCVLVWHSGRGRGGGPSCCVSAASGVPVLV